MANSISSDLSTIKSLLGLIPTRRGSVTAIASLGLLSSLFEGVGLYLFLPLLNTLSTAEGSAIEYPAVFSPILDKVSPNWVVAVLAGLVLLCIVLKNAVSYANSAMFALVNCRAGHLLRTKLYRQILSASAQHINKESTGRIANAMLSESWRAVEALGVLYRLIVNSCTTLVLFGLLMILSWRGALVALPIGLFILALLHRFTRFTQQIGNESVSVNAAFIARFWETMEGLTTIRQFDRVKLERRKFEKISTGIVDVYIRMQLLGNTIGPVLETLVAFVVAGWIIVLFGLGLNIASITVLFLILFRLKQSLLGLATGRNQLLQLTRAVEEIETVGVACAESALAEGTQPLLGLKSGIQFRDVSDRYPGRDNLALQNVDIWIPAGKYVAIVGRSGAGKSTLTVLLCHDKDPADGEILVDGINLKTIRNADWRRRVGIVSQHVHLFSATVAENISYGIDNASTKAIEEAARIAHCHEFICALPQGYQTEIGEKGLRLSGGQRQRLALARAFIRNPDILILDEATNALDSETELAIQATLAQLPAKTTLISIAHRISTVRAADHVIVLDGGRVVEQGSPGSLRLSDGHFAHLERLQSLD